MIVICSNCFNDTRIKTPTLERIAGAITLAYTQRERERGSSTYRPPVLVTQLFL